MTNHYFLCENCHEERHRNELTKCRVCDGLVCGSCLEYHEMIKCGLVRLSDEEMIKLGRI